jgi:hypothetical protein
MRALAAVLLVALAACESREEYLARHAARPAAVYEECKATCPRGLVPAVVASGQYGLPECSCFPPGAEVRQ